MMEQGKGDGKKPEERARGQGTEGGGPGTANKRVEYISLCGNGSGRREEDGKSFVLMEKARAG